MIKGVILIVIAHQLTLCLSNKNFDRSQFIYIHGASVDQNTRYSFQNLTKILNHQSFDLNKKTVLYCHGWFDSFVNSGTQMLINAFIRRRDSNFIMFDWSDYDNTFLSLAVLRSSIISRFVGKSLLNLYRNGLNANNFHCVGHSIGSHICGNAGKEVIRNSNGQFKFDRITGLDPAQLFFINSIALSNRLTSSDAVFVDVIHTASFLVGIPQAIGTVDFYPNGGFFQSDCNIFGVLILNCSHWQAWYLFAMSLLDEYKYPARLCSSYDNFNKGACNNNPINYLGYGAMRKMQGVYYLNVTKSEILSTDEIQRTIGGIVFSFFTKNDLVTAIKDSRRLRI